MKSVHETFMRFIGEPYSGVFGLVGWGNGDEMVINRTPVPRGVLRGFAVFIC